MTPETAPTGDQDRIPDTAALMEALSGLTEAQHGHFLRNAVEAALTYRASGDTDVLVRFADGLLASAELRHTVPSYRTAFTHSQDVTDSVPVPAATWPGGGDFVRSSMAHIEWARVHIAVEHTPSVTGDPYSVRMACGRWLLHRHLVPANGDDPRQCGACWDAM